MTELIQCNCKNEFQDELYGNGIRLANTTNNGYRCTVCGKDYRTGDVKKR